MRSTMSGGVETSGNWRRRSIARARVSFNPTSCRPGGRVATQARRCLIAKNGVAHAAERLLLRRPRTSALAIRGHSGSAAQTWCAPDRPSWRNWTTRNLGNLAGMLPLCCQNKHLIECSAMKSKKHSNSQGIEYPLTAQPRAFGLLTPMISPLGCLPALVTAILEST